MLQVPAATPVTMPVELTVATEGLLLLHVPPGVLSERATDAPTQVPDGPTIGAMVVAPVTVKDIVRKQPLPNVYVMVQVPAATPVTTPVAMFTEAIAVLLLLHVPPETALLSVLVPLTGIDVMPDIAAGAGVTFTPLMAVQPPASDVSGTDLGPVPRFSGLVRSAFSRSEGGVDVRYLGPAAFEAVRAH